MWIKDGKHSAREIIECQTNQITSSVTDNLMVVDSELCCRAWVGGRIDDGAYDSFKKRKVRKRLAKIKATKKLHAQQFRKKGKTRKLITLRWTQMKFRRTLYPFSILKITIRSSEK